MRAQKIIREFKAWTWRTRQKNSIQEFKNNTTQKRRNQFNKNSREKEERDLCSLLETQVVH